MKIRIPPLYHWAAETLGKGQGMQRLARWHIWFAWLAGIPILMWVVTGLIMVVKPIEEVRGNHLRVEAETQPLDLSLTGDPIADGEVKEMRAYMQRGVPVTKITLMDGSVQRVDMRSGEAIPALGPIAARALVAEQIKGGDAVESVALFQAEEVPFDFRRKMPVWQVALNDGTHVYVGRDTGEIEAVRTQWWRLFDFVWGLHIMDLDTRELDEQSPFNYAMLVGFAALAAIGSLFGVILMFRRRKRFLRW